MTREQAHKIIDMRFDGSTAQEIANELGYTKQHIHEWFRTFISKKWFRAGGAETLYPVMIDTMREKHLTQTKLAELAGTSVNTVSRFLNGKSVTLETAEKIANALGLTLSEALNKEKPPTNER